MLTKRVQKMSIKKVIEEIIDDEIELFSDFGRITSKSGKSYYFKSGDPSRTYQCESNGLKELSKSPAIRVPEVIAVSDTFILTEYIFECTPLSNFYTNFGKQIAELHRVKSDSYGFYEDNFIGDNPQLNIPTKSQENNWIDFFFNKRLLFQYKKAEQNHLVTKDMKRSFSHIEYVIESLLKEAIEPPTLIHGDIWVGNFIPTSEYEAVLIDPAVYYGHREAELAMTRLFGGFSQDFYDSYQKQYPLQPGWEKREKIYRLYHVLNHLNLFGSGYLAEAESLMRDIGSTGELEYLVSQRI